MRSTSNPASARLRVVGYARVSTALQAELGTSLHAQRTRLEAYALAMDLELIAVLTDTASAKTLDRPGLAAALALIDERAADAIVVVKLDRLTRSVRDLGLLVERYFAGRCSLVSLGDAIDTRTASGRLVLHILGAVCQWEREAIAERTRDALAELREQGVRLGGEALGWRRVPSCDDHGRYLMGDVGDEVATIARMGELRRAGHSLRAIAQRLAVEGHRTKRGGRWHATTVQRVLQRQRAHS